MIDGPEILTILSQLPVVAVFTWLVLLLLKEFKSFIVEERKEFLSALREISCELKGVKEKQEQCEEKISALSVKIDRYSQRAHRPKSADGN